MVSLQWECSCIYSSIKNWQWIPSAKLLPLDEIDSNGECILCLVCGEYLYAPISEWTDTLAKIKIRNIMDDMTYTITSDTQREAVIQTVLNRVRKHDYHAERIYKELRKLKTVSLQT